MSISPTAFLPISFPHEITNSKCQYRKAAQTTFVQKAACKMLLNLTPVALHFMSSFCSNILSTKNYKAKLILEKSWAKHFCTKRHK